MARSSPARYCQVERLVGYGNMGLAGGLRRKLGSILREPDEGGRLGRDWLRGWPYAIRRLAIPEALAAARYISRCTYRNRAAVCLTLSIVYPHTIAPNPRQKCLY